MDMEKLMKQAEALGLSVEFPHEGRVLVCRRDEIVYGGIHGRSPLEVGAWLDGATFITGVARTRALLTDLIHKAGCWTQHDIPEPPPATTNDEEF